MMMMHGWKRCFHNQHKMECAVQSVLTLEALFYYCVLWRIAVILCRVAMWLHPGCYKKATPAPTLERTAQCGDWVVLHSVGQYGLCAYLRLRRVTFEIYQPGISNVFQFQKLKPSCALSRWSGTSAETRKVVLQTCSLCSYLLIMFSSHPPEDSNK